jgi:hypothetical protein
MQGLIDAESGLRCILLPATCYLLPATCYLLPATCYPYPVSCIILTSSIACLDIPYGVFPECLGWWKIGDLIEKGNLKCRM